MNLLFCELFNPVKISSGLVHIYEVLSGFSRLGHNIVLVNGRCFVHSLINNIDRQPPHPSPWTRLENRLGWFRILRPLRGEITILWLLLREVWIFILAFITIVKWKGKFDVIYGRHREFSCQYLLAKLFGIRSVKEVNGIGVDEGRIHKEDSLSLWFIDRIERFNMPKADKIIVVTSRLRETLNKDYGVPGDKIVVIPNGANTHLFQPMDTTEARQRLSLNQNDSYVCFIGTLWGAQGVDNLIKSVPLVVEKLLNTKFLMVGDGATKQDLVSLAEQVGVSDKVIFTGMVPYQEVPLYINASDVCVVPAAKNFRNDRTGGSPLKLHEYMACGRPVVVGNIAGDNEDVTDAGLGLVVDSTNIKEMARAIITLLRNEQLRKEMGIRARKITVEKYSWRKIAEQVVEVCQSVTNR